ncbi:MAG: hypothetical protein KZQ64_10425 [gamma proteobacterium symbiont of Bathyaustriella thionipta]|nr:hypothetical protein [gamma proteobacterium symbiont of Bathyaustriella thionipta]MCU7948938.1 hypothetical protein [gamma proteobacterium symbiont of Bathyaustriella thionipta]MCU7953787.1 hypothetical protein [gamma proteobacterium symbiont of Bathyaustriella thionipta]MCU7955461.1 hypothetical protein [gamma proteobacterium symbiont of Bathyaustriella thionipta]MCU7966414.1 hypothetical protein [gamma proteobacterium symbiont of Bathyaustriella thionipta]
MKILLNTILFALLMSMASVSFAEYGYYDDDELTEEDVMVDLFLVRPLGVAGSAAGLIMQGVGLLFSVPGENFGETGELLVEEPLNYTFNRPLGRFEND